MCVRAEPLSRSQHTAKFSGYKCYGKRDINCSNYHKIYHDHLIQGHVTIWNRVLKASQQPTKFAGHGYCSGRNMF